MKVSVSAITLERIEIFWLLDQILKALIEADRMVPLLRVYEAILKFEISTKKKHIRKKNVFYICFFFGSYRFSFRNESSNTDLNSLDLRKILTFQIPKTSIFSKLTN